MLSRFALLDDHLTLVLTCYQSLCFPPSVHVRTFAMERYELLHIKKYTLHSEWLQICDAFRKPPPLFWHLVWSLLPMMFSVDCISSTPKLSHYRDFWNLSVDIKIKLFYISAFRFLLITLRVYWFLWCHVSWLTEEWQKSKANKELYYAARIQKNICSVLLQ